MSESTETAQTTTPKAIALDLGVSPKTLRKFLRDDVKVRGIENPGKGGRWAIDLDSVDSLKKRFAAWVAAKAAKAEEAAESDDEVEVLDEDDSEIEEISLDDE